MAVHLAGEVEHLPVPPADPSEEGPPDREHTRQDDRGGEGELPGDEEHEDGGGRELEDRREDLCEFLGDERAELFDIVREPGDDLADPRLAEEAEIQLDEVIVDGVAHVARYRLLDPGDEVDAGEVEEVLQDEDGEDEEDDSLDRLVARPPEFDEAAERGLKEAVEERASRRGRLRESRLRLREERPQEWDQEGEGEGVEGGEDRGRDHGEREHAGIGPEVGEDPEVEGHLGPRPEHRGRGDPVRSPERPPTKVPGAVGTAATPC